MTVLCANIELKHGPGSFVFYKKDKALYPNLRIQGRCLTKDGQGEAAKMRREMRPGARYSHSHLLYIYSTPCTDSLSSTVNIEGRMLN